MERVLMYSGGLDSFILKHLYDFEDEECLFINIGTDENQVEENHIKKYFPKIKVLQFPLVRWELSNKIIPFRNSFLALAAAQYAECIYFGYTIGDTTRDKDYVFKAQMEGMLNYFAGTGDKIGIKLNKGYEIYMPFKQTTKSELVFQFLETGYNYQDLFEKSVSCYEGSDIPCGKCRSCLRKYVAVWVGFKKYGLNIAVESFFKNNPRKMLNEFYVKSENKDRKEELYDIIKCING